MFARFYTGVSVHLCKLPFVCSRNFVLHTQPVYSSCIMYQCSHGPEIERRNTLRENFPNFDYIILKALEM